MFGLGVGEVLLILVIGLVLFGGKRLGDVARLLGRSLVEFKKEASGLADDLSPAPKPPSR
jgi:TatA/E family protein of Tat protein translocase